MGFLKTEVEGAERISLAVEGFSLDANDSKQKRSKPKIVHQSIPTAAGLINHNVSVKCLFCEGNHTTERCIKAQKFTYEEKKSTLKKKRACFRCAKIGHSSRQCRERLQCLICGRQHLSLLCPTLTVKGNHEDNKSKPTEISKDFPTEAGLTNHTDSRVFLQTLIVKIRSESGEREVRAIIDTGSQRSYVLKHIADELNYKPKRSETIAHALFGGAQTAEQEHACYDVRLVSLDGKYACRFEALDQPIICNDIPSVYTGVWTNELKDSNINLTDTRGRLPIAVLIGADVAGKILTEKRKVLDCGLVAIGTLLGWVLMGKVSGNSKSSSTTMTVTNMLNKDASIAALWQLDVLGISDPGERKSKTELEMAAKQLFEETVAVTEDGRYEVKLPWLEDHPPLSSNYALAKKRLVPTENKLQKSNYCKAYDKVFSEWLEEDVIEEVPMEQFDSPDHYLPHRPVIKESSATTKIRPVFDALAREEGKPSLNDCLVKGSNLIDQIPTLLLWFRRDEIGITSDIKKAFLQINLNPNDRDFLRFIWKTVDGNERIFRHKRVVFGVNASPFLLGATIEHHLKRCLEKCEEGKSGHYKKTIETLRKGFYVDNCITSMPNRRELEIFITEATEVMAKAKFELRGWEYTRKHDNDTTIVPILGLSWNKTTDTLAISGAPEEETEVMTKRTILSFAQRIFDPIGFTSPAILCPKILLQEMWEEKIGWDVEVKEETKKIFGKWKTKLPFLSKIEIPRWINIDLNRASSVLVFWLEVTWVITLFLQLCVRNENNRMWRCWQGVVWVNGWKKTFVYGSLGTIPLIWPHKLWLAYVAGGQLVALALFHLLLSFKGRRRRKRKDRLLNGDIDSFESSRFEEVTEVLDDGLPEPIPGSSHSLSDSLAEPDTILEI